MPRCTHTHTHTQAHTHTPHTHTHMHAGTYNITLPGIYILFYLYILFRQVIDSHLNWKQHILSVSKKMSRCIGMCKLRQFVSRNKLKNIYNSLLYPHLVHAIQVYGESETESEMNKIFVLQKRALRIITFNKVTRTFVPIKSNFFMRWKS